MGEGRVPPAPQFLDMNQQPSDPLRPLQTEEQQTECVLFKEGCRQLPSPGCPARAGGRGGGAPAGEIHQPDNSHSGPSKGAAEEFEP